LNRPTYNARGDLCGRTGQLANAHRIILCSVRAAYSTVTTVLLYNTNSCCVVLFQQSDSRHTPIANDTTTAGGSCNNILTDDESYRAREYYQVCGELDATYCAVHRDEIDYISNQHCITNRCVENLLRNACGCRPAGGGGGHMLRYIVRYYYYYYFNSTPLVR